MKAYMIIEIAVTDPALYARYMEQAPGVVQQYGGRYLVRGGEVKPLTGGWAPERVIVLEFESAEQMRRWNTSPEYQALAPLRIQSTVTRAIALEGCAEDGTPG